MGRHSWVGVVAVAVVALIVAGLPSVLRARPQTATWSSGGLVLTSSMTASYGRLDLVTRLTNRTSGTVALRSGECHRVTQVRVTKPRAPEGRTWAGSVQALKRAVIERRRFEDRPERGAPYRCAPGRSTVRIAPGAHVDERWMLDDYPRGSTLTVTVPGRSVRLRVTASGGSAPRPSAAVRLDRALADEKLRSWVAAQPADSWRDASDRITPFPTGPPELPPGVRILPDAQHFQAYEDVLPGRIELPSGRVVVSGNGVFSWQDEIKGVRVPPGAYPVRLTVARDPKGDEALALATLVVSSRPTVAWRDGGGVGTDGGDAGFASVEAAKKLDGGDLSWLDEFSARVWGARLDPGAIVFATGFGDGGYGSRSAWTRATARRGSWSTRSSCTSTGRVRSQADATGTYVPHTELLYGSPHAVRFFQLAWKRLPKRSSRRCCLLAVLAPLTTSSRILLERRSS